jgi:hypothetical protein
MPEKRRIKVIAVIAAKIPTVLTNRFTASFFFPSIKS